MNQRRLSIFALAAVSALVLSGCSVLGEEPADEPGEGLGILTVGSVMAFAPLSMTVNNEPTGFDVELVEELADRVGYTDVEWIVSDFAGLIPSVASGKIDMADNTTGWAEPGTTSYEVVTKRTEQVSFSRPWFLQVAHLVSTDEGLTNVDQLEAGMKVAVEDKTQYFIWAQEHLVPRGIELVPGPQTGLYTQLESGIVDAVLDGTVHASEASNSIDSLIIGDEISETAGGFCFVIAPENDVLLEQMNDGLAELIEDGTYEELFAKYFPGLETPDLPTNNFPYTG